MEFGLDDKVAIERLAECVGQKLHDAAVLSEARTTRRKSQALVEVVRAVNIQEKDSEADVDKLTGELVRLAYEILDCDRITLFRVDRINNVCVVKESRDSSFVGAKIPMSSESIVARVARGSAPRVLINDCYNDQGWMAGGGAAVDKKHGYTTRSMLCMPIKDKSGTPVAVLQVRTMPSVPA